MNARQVGVSHRAIAHGDSVDASSLRGELERHIKGGGATVLVMPIVDPLIMDVGGPGATRETLDEGEQVIIGAEEFGLIRNRRSRALARFRRDVLGGWQFHGHQACDRGKVPCASATTERPGRLLRPRPEHLLRHVPGALDG